MDIYGNYLAALSVANWTVGGGIPFSSLQVWHIDTGEQVYSEYTQTVFGDFHTIARGSDYYMTRVKFDHEGRLAVCMSICVIIFDIPSLRGEIHSLTQCPKSRIDFYHPRFVAFNGHGTMAVGNMCDSISLFDVATGQAISKNTFLDDLKDCNSRAFVFSGKDHLLCGFCRAKSTISSTLILVDITTFTIIRTFAETVDITYLAVNGLGMLASGDDLGDIKIWDINSGKLLRTIVSTNKR